MPDQNRLLYVAQAAEKLSCSRQFIYNLLSDGKIKGVRSGSYLRVFEASLLEFIEKTQFLKGKK